MGAIQNLSSDKPKLIVPSDTLKLTYNGESKKTQYIMVGVPGDIAFKDSENVTVIVPSVNFIVGTMYPIATDQILATGTTATGIVGWFN